MEDTYICIMRGGMISSVTIVNSDIAEKTIRQFRSSGLCVRSFNTREKYLEFCVKNDLEHAKNVRMQREAGLA